MNLGDHVNDQPQDVTANRRDLQLATGVAAVYLSQVHGNQVVELSASSAMGQPADACFTDQPGLACCIMVADCLPVLLSDRQGTFVAAAHAGWRGLAGDGMPTGQGVLAALMAQLRRKKLLGQANDTSNLIAWLGPCIGPDAFEVGLEVKQAFEKQASLKADCFKSAGSMKWRADLAGLARHELMALGVKDIFGNDSSPTWCTVSNPSRFFSYRRDGLTGRMAALVWRV